MKRNRYTRFILLLLLLFPALSGAQSWFYRQYTAEQGLPSTEVHDIIQDKKGYIWVATDRGVARFDGYSFEAFSTSEGLSSNVVFRLSEGPDGRIWFAEMPGTLSYYKEGKIYPAPENAAIKKHFRYTSFPTCLVAGKDHVDIGYEGSGIYRVQQGKVIELYTADTAGNIVIGEKDQVVFGSRKGKIGFMIRYRDRSYYFPHDDWRYSNRVRALKRRNGDLIVAACGVVYVLKKNGTIKKHITRNMLTSFSETQDSCLYAMGQKGFYRYTPNEEFVLDDRFCHLKSSRINKIMMDREGGLWVATLDKGVFYCAHSGFTTYEFNDEIPEGNNLVYSLCGDYKGKVFAGLQSGSIYCFDRGKAPFRAFAPPRANIDYNHIFYDTVNDYLLVDKLKRILPRYKDAIRFRGILTGNGAVPYRSGYLSGNYHNLIFSYWEAEDWKYINLEGVEPKLQCMLRLAADSIFIGSLAGLNLYHKGTYTSMLAGTPYALERINDIECTGQRELVLATIGNGLLFYNLNTRKLHRISSKDGLSSDVINDVALAPDGTLWLAGNRGLSRLSKDSKGRYTIRNYTSYNGIPIADLKNVYADSNTVYMGTHNGLVLFDQRSSVIDHDPEIVLRAVYLNDKKVPLQKLTQLTSRQNNLRISYLAIIPKMLGQVLYRYQLRGSKSDRYWVYVREPQLFLSSVEPGDYRLVIQACNSAGQWSKIPLVLPIRIAAPFWKTWWFIVCCILAIAGIVIFFQSLKLKRLRERSANEKLMLDYQQQALINQINPHFLFNSMNSIQKYILREDKEQAVSFVSKFAKLMRLGLEQSREAFIPLSEELELLQVYMLLEGERFGKKVTYCVTIQEDLETQRIKIPPMLIQPFIENALRHGILNKPDKGTIILRLYKNDQLLFCEVEDDGIGRKRAMEIKLAQEQAHRSFALSINTSRLQLLAKSLNSIYFFDITDKTDESGNPSGTLVKLVLPYKYEA